MKRFVEGEDRNQSTLFPERLDEYIAEDNPVRVIDIFVDELDLGDLGFERFIPQVTGQLMPDFKTIADFRKDNSKAIRQVCREFIELGRGLELFTQTILATIKARQLKPAMTLASQYWSPGHRPRGTKPQVSLTNQTSITMRARIIIRTRQVKSCNGGSVLSKRARPCRCILRLYWCAGPAS
jgi:hypothetical protein